MAATLPLVRSWKINPYGRFLAGLRLLHPGFAFECRDFFMTDIIDRIIEYQLYSLSILPEYQVHDIRCMAVRLGLEDAFRSRIVPEQGLQLVDKKGRIWSHFPANCSGEGLQSFMTDNEIMRGDLCRLLHDSCQKRVNYRFGGWVEQISQNPEYAEMILEPGAADPFHSLGVCGGYLTIKQPVQPGEGYNATALLAPGNKGIMTRRGDSDKYQAYLFCRPSASERLQNPSKRNFQDEKEGFVEVFRDAGWRIREILQGLVNADDFYCERTGVVKMDHWSRGRVVLVGDAAYCPIAMTGMGTSSGMAGAYVLAGEIGKYCNGDNSLDSIKAALARYEEKLRLFIHTVQRGIGEDYMDKFPSSMIGIQLVYVVS